MFKAIDFRSAMRTSGRGCSATTLAAVCKFFRLCLCLRCDYVPVFTHLHRINPSTITVIVGWIQAFIFPLDQGQTNITLALSCKRCGYSKLTVVEDRRTVNLQ